MWRRTPKIRRPHNVISRWLWVLIFSFYAAGFSIVAQKNSEKLAKAEKFYFAKKFESASVLLKQICEEDPENGRANSLLGDIYIFQGQFDKAVSHLLRAAELNAQNAPDLFRLGQAYEKSGKSKDAISAYQRAYAADAQLKEALFQKGWVYFTAERDKAQTIAAWKQFVAEAASYPQHPKVVAVLKILEDPNFVLPEKGSPVSLDEALMLGKQPKDEKPAPPKEMGAGYEKEKEKNDPKELLDDDKLN